MPAVDVHTHAGGRRASAAARASDGAEASLPRGGRRCAPQQGSMSGVGVSSVGGPAAVKASNAARKNQQSAPAASREVPAGGKACNAAQYRRTEAAECDHGPRSVTMSAKKNDTAFGFAGAGTQSAQEGSPARGLSQGSQRRQYGATAGALGGAGAIRSTEYDGYTTAHMP